MATKKGTDDSSSTESYSVTSEPISILQDLLDLEEIDLNLYRGFSPQNPRWGRVYGGQTVSQALVAACCTVSPAYTVHSLHSYFLRPGNNDLPILYYVDRLRDGRSFCTRRVIALQSGRAIFVMSVSFHVHEEGFEHQDPFPAGIPSPDTLPSYMDLMKKYSQDQRLPKPVRKGLLRSSSFPFPLDIRKVGQRDLGNAEVLLAGSEPHQQAWMRTTGRLSDSLVLHQCALAYLSDWSLIETATLPHGIHPYHSPHLHLASIDHAMWFHAPFRADEWLLYDMQSPRASAGRGLAFGKFYTPDGKLVVTTAQEGLIRISVPKSLSDSSATTATATAKAKGAAKTTPSQSRTEMTTATLATRAPPPKAQYAATNPPSFPQSIPTPTPISTAQTSTQTTSTSTQTFQNNNNNNNTNVSPTRPCPANRISSLYKFAPAWDPASASIPTSTSTSTSASTSTTPAPAPGVAASPTCSTSAAVNPPAVSSVSFSTSSARTDHHSKL